MKLTDVFEGLELNDKLSREFENIEVDRMEIQEKTGYVWLYLILQDLVPWESVRDLEKVLNKHLFSETEGHIYIRESYKIPDTMTSEEIYTEFRESFFAELRAESFLNEFVARTVNSSFTDDKMTIDLRETSLDKKFGEVYKKYFESTFRERFNKALQVELNYIPEPEKTYEFCDGPREYVSPEHGFDRVESSKPAETKPAAAPASSENKEAAKKNAGAAAFNKYKNKTKLPPDPDLFFGRNFDGEAVQLSAIQDEIGEVVVSGQTSKYEEREIKKVGKWLITFCITDFTDSLNVKLFLSPEQKDDFCAEYKDGMFVKLKGVVKYDTYDKELGISSVVGMKKSKDTRKKRMDNAPEKRIELHAHTKMSDMDAVAEPSDLFKTAFKWGHKAVAITDHGVVQGFTDAFHAYQKMFGDAKNNLKKNPDSEEAKQAFDKINNFKIIYGCEGYLVDDVKDIAINADGINVDAPIVAISLVMDGTNAARNMITSFAAVRLSGGEPASLVRDVIAGDISELFDFIKGCVVLTLRPDQDMSFMREAAMRLGIDYNFPCIDLDNLARMLYPEFQSYKIGALAKEFKYKGETKGTLPEAKCIFELWNIFRDELKAKEIESFEMLNNMGSMSEKAIKSMKAYHVILLCQSEVGRINLYKLISHAHINYFHKMPRIPKSDLIKHREGIIVGSACEAGELFRAIAFNRPEHEIRRLAKFYDYYEVQPIGNNDFMKESSDFDVTTDEDLRNLNRRIVELGEEYGKPVVATCDVHFLNPEDSIYRSIIMAAHGFKDADRQPPLYLHTTEEMLDEFSYLGAEKAYEIVVTNTNKIADSIEKIDPVFPDKAPPVIKDSDITLQQICYDKAHSMYGETLPAIVQERLERELNSIIKNGFAVMYIIAQKLVWKSNEDGYLVGSRGSVGSSFVATMSGITEVNPLPAHYYCPECHYSDFDSEIVKEYFSKSGFDLPDAVCPKCGTKLIKDGQNIPFETFLGFYGDKEPDIDLNFSGEYQSKAHAYTEVIFGEGQTFRAGTITGLADKTAYSYAVKYFEDQKVTKRRCEMERLAKGCEGVRKSTGQHPGGIIVLPYGEEIYKFTPVQRPANDMTTTTVTTHFDYHSIDHNLLKLDILGHDDPTMIRFLQDLTNMDVKDIPLDDKDVISLFSSPKALGLNPEDIEGCPTGTWGLPELGTDFVIQMLVDTQPKCFSDLIRISGLSHGTDVWLGNTQTLIAEGKCDLSTAICTRDDIMIYLISKNIEPGVSFKIMESVRKGKGLSADWEQLMKDHDVPDWYIWSCKKIKYMFPKAHAAAYIMMALRIAWFKVHIPLAYYAAYFSIRATAMDYAKMCRGKQIMLEECNKLKAKKAANNPEDKFSPKDEDTLKDMKNVLEMYQRGLEFTPIDIFKAKATRFQIVDNKLMPSLSCIEGLGENAAMQIEEGVKKGAFSSLDDFKRRCKLSQTVVDKMAELGLLGSLPKSDQISFSDIFGDAFN